MSIEHLFDTMVRIWRPTVTMGAQRNEIVTYVPQNDAPTEPNAVVNRSVARGADTGPGIAAVGERKLYMEAEVDVQLRDVLEFTDGPDQGYRGEVDDVPSRPRGHHTEIQTTVWHGKLPGDP